MHVRNWVFPRVYVNILINVNYTDEPTRPNAHLLLSPEMNSTN